MYRYKIAYFLLFFLNLISIEPIIGQEKFKFTEREIFPKSTDNIVNVFEDSINNRLIGVYSNSSEIETIKEGPYKGMNTAKVEGGIQLLVNNGNRAIRMSFEDNENFLCYYNGHIYTTKINLSDDSKEIRKYNISTNRLQLIKSRNVGYSEWEVAPIANSGIFIVSDTYELYGTRFTIYSSDLDSLNSYVPFQNGGFQHSAFAANDKMVFIIIHPEKIEDDIKIALLDINTGNLIIDKSYTKNIFITNQVVAADNYFVIRSTDNKLRAIDNEGNQKWEKQNMKYSSLSIKNLIIDNENEVLYTILVGNKLICINSEDGNVLWEKNIMKLYPYSLINSNEVLPLEFKILQKNMIGLVIGKIIYNEKEQKYTYENLVFYIFNSDGVLIHTNKLGSIFNPIILKSLGRDKFLLIKDNKAVTYEESK